jgi:tRNA-dihydrouridine synthase B
MLSQFGTNAGVRLARKHLSWYSRGLPGSAEFRAAMNRIPDAEQVLQLLDSFYDPLIARGITRTGPTNDASIAEAA